MHWRYLLSDLRWSAAHRLRRLRFFWYTADRAAWLFVAFFATVVTLLLFGFQAAIGLQDERRERERQRQAKDLACLARNVYFEARGEPLAGQYAVAEVTMNRRASRHFPRTVCDVVYQKNWDPLRGRYVSAFSWTEFTALTEPEGETWERARRVAEAVYYQKYTPQLRGALFFHATYIQPEWAKEKRRIAQIGRHVFYR